MQLNHSCMGYWSSVESNDFRSCAWQIGLNRAKSFWKVCLVAGIKASSPETWIDDQLYTVNHSHFSSTVHCTISVQCQTVRPNFPLTYLAALVLPKPQSIDQSIKRNLQCCDRYRVKHKPTQEDGLFMCYSCEQISERSTMAAWRRTGSLSRSSQSDRINYQYQHINFGPSFSYGGTEGPTPPNTLDSLEAIPLHIFTPFTRNYASVHSRSDDW